MKADNPKTTKLKDYSPNSFLIDTVHLTFDLHDTQTRVKNVMKIRRNPSSQNLDKMLRLNGEELKFLDAFIDGKKLTSDQLEFVDDFLVIKEIPQTDFELVIENEINPSANKALDGLYKSGDIFCTQNEPEGFRRISYFIDRPDIMAVFTTKIIADKKLYPVLLSNGNLTDQGELEDGRHWVEWNDPFPKPCYLYALVAGDLALVQDEFTTSSGRTIDLRIYVDKGNEDKCDHAMESLKKSMKWDEERFGLEYDLDIYMIVAVDSFNMGAMENKGLNIFNSAYVLAKQETATDDNFLGIESVIGHEYFHNWTGNRVTCRDWFQLTLKEGLTVFRDQEFSADMNSPATQRIQDVQQLRQFQFAEDAGPTAHPIKPDSYIEINNFYTMTIYEKGAEVIRMLHTILGEEGFRKGMDLYFKLYDGQAVTTEDFINAMSEANHQFDLSQFQNWYHQAGTPEVNVKTSFDEQKKEFRLSLSQSCSQTPGLNNDLPFVIPLRFGLVGPNGKDLEVSPESVTKSDQPFLDKKIIYFNQKEDEFIFRGIEHRPVLSLNRGFSAPINLKGLKEFEDLVFLMKNDSDEFNRFEAANSLAFREVEKLLTLTADGRSWDDIVQSFENQAYLDAYGQILVDESLDPSIKAMMLSLPSVSLLQQSQNPVNHREVFEARESLKRILAQKFEKEFLAIYEQNHEKGAFSLSGEAIAKRDLKAVCLSFLSVLGKQEHFKLIKQQFNEATNMTDESMALGLLTFYTNDFTDTVSADFYKKWKEETLVMQKWIALHASAPSDQTFDKVHEIEKDAIFDINVPNLVRSLLGAFARNPVQFHHPSGRGYRYIVDQILKLDTINPQVASGLLGAFRDFQRLESGQKELMKKELERVKSKENISKNTYEIVTKIL